MKALIDMDIVVYSAGFASDQRTYLLPDGEVFASKKEANEYATAKGYTNEDITLTVTPEPLEYCLQNVKKLIQDIVISSGATEYIGFLTGKGNYRETVDATQLYKGNRDSTHKPFWYNEIKEYLVSKHNGIIVDGYEADDAMGIAQYSDWNTKFKDGAVKTALATVICTKDKDLDMIPGWHYNWGTKELYMVDEQQASSFFYQQLLTGDSVDNILGCAIKEECVYKTGAKKGQTYLRRKGVSKKQAENILSFLRTEQDMYEVVLEEYEAIGLTEFDLLENATLLWIMRERDTHWTPPNRRTE